MSPTPAFTVRYNPAFRFRRYFRVYVDRDALYLIRMGGMWGLVEVGNPDTMLAWAGPVTYLIARWLSPLVNRRLATLDERGPHGLIDAHPENRRYAPSEIASARLDPPSILSESTIEARFTLTPKGARTRRYEIVDDRSLRTALAFLPRLLGPTLTVTVARDESAVISIRM